MLWLLEWWLVLCVEFSEIETNRDYIGCLHMKIWKADRQITQLIICQSNKGSPLTQRSCGTTVLFHASPTIVNSTSFFYFPLVSQILQICCVRNFHRLRTKRNVWRTWRCFGANCFLFLPWGLVFVKWFDSTRLVAVVLGTVSLWLISLVEMFSVGLPADEPSVARDLRRDSKS